MHVMHVIDGLAIGGAERMLVDIANQTSIDDIGVSVCVTRSDRTLARELRGGIPIAALDRASTFDPNGFKRFAALLRMRKVDLFHAHGFSTFAFLAVAKLLGLARAPIILHDHYGNIEFDRPVPPWFQVWGKAQLERYVGVYRKLALWAQAAGVPARKIEVIENALDLSRFGTGIRLNIRRELGIPADVAVGVALGNFRFEKGYDVLIEAIAMSACRERMRVVCVGGPRDRAYYDACRARVAALGLDRHVIFLGERADALHILRGADFALLPSRSESGPLALIEYMASGLPFVATRVGAIGQRVAELGVPECVPAGDARSLAHALDCLVALSPSERQARGRLGQAIALRHFDIAKTMPRWYELYSAVLGARI